MILTPFANFKECADCFDPDTLVRQCISVYRLIEKLQQNNPHSDEARSFFTLWRPYQQALIQYGTILAQRCSKLGRTSLFKIFTSKFQVTQVIMRPKWLGWEKLHASHRSRLIFLGNRKIVKEGLKRFLVGQKTVNEWVKDTYGKKLNKMDLYELNQIKRRLMQNHIQLQSNFYKELGFTDDPSDYFVWPEVTMHTDYRGLLTTAPSPPDLSSVRGRDDMFPLNTDLT